MCISCLSGKTRTSSLRTIRGSYRSLKGKIIDMRGIDHLLLTIGFKRDSNSSKATVFSLKGIRRSGKLARIINL